MIRLLAVLSLLSAIQPQPAEKPATQSGDKPAEPAKPAFQGDGYYLGTCAECRQTLGLGDKGDTIHALYNGREILFCEAKCRQEFEKDLPGGLAALDERIVKDQLLLYPVDTSIVSGKPLGDKPINWVWNNRLIRLADADEKKAFLLDPPRYLKTLNDAVKSKQRPAYTITKCVVQGDQLDDDAEETVVANRLVRICCTSCAKRIRANPRMYVQMIDYAREHPPTPAR